MSFERHVRSHVLRLSAGLFALIACPLGAQEQAADAPSPPPVAADVPAGAVAGLGDINLFPKRLVLDGSREIAMIGLYNKAASEGDYEITLRNLRMTSDGQLVPLEASDPAAGDVRPASDMVRHSPRRVTLRPDESQTVRLMLRAPADLPPGEYRTHFQVVSIPRDVVDGVSINEAVGEAETGGIGVKIRPRIGLSIPVIVRIGATTLEAGIADARVLTAADGSQAVEFTLTRRGTRSAYGDITITAAGLGEPLAVLRGVGVYPEVSARRVTVPLPVAQPALREGTRLKITFTDDDHAPGTLLATHELAVP